MCSKSQASVGLILLSFFSLETFMAVKTQEEFQLWVVLYRKKF